MDSQICNGVKADLLQVCSQLVMHHDRHCIHTSTHSHLQLGYSLQCHVASCGFVKQMVSRFSFWYCMKASQVISCDACAGDNDISIAVQEVVYHIWSHLLAVTGFLRPSTSANCLTVQLSAQADIPLRIYCTNASDLFKDSLQGFRGLG